MEIGRTHVATVVTQIAISPALPVIVVIKGVPLPLSPRIPIRGEASPAPATIPTSISGVVAINKFAALLRESVRIPVTPPSATLAECRYWKNCSQQEPKQSEAKVAGSLRKGHAKPPDAIFLFCRVPFGKTRCVPSTGQGV